METWIEVQPGGYLKKYGNHRFYVKTPAEAIRAMISQVDGFGDAFKSADKRGIKFAVITDKRQISDPEHLKMGKPKIIKLVPKYEGAKNSGGIFLAAGLIVATVFTGGLAMSIAFSLAMGGITQMLAPKPPGLSTKTDVENKPSYAFGGPTNTTAQGQALGVLYGEREVGGAVVSASVVSEDQM